MASADPMRIGKLDRAYVERHSRGLRPGRFLDLTSASADGEKYGSGLGLDGDSRKMVLWGTMAVAGVVAVVAGTYLFMRWHQRRVDYARENR